MITNELIFTEDELRIEGEEERRENSMNLLISAFITGGLVYIALMVGLFL